MSKSRNKHPRLKNFTREYRVELIALATGLFAVFLLVEPFAIRATLRSWLSQGDDLLLDLTDRLMAAVDTFTVSDLTGLVLLALAAAFIAWRIHYRLLRTSRLDADACPKCSGPLQRTHRTFFDRLIALALQIPLRRYHCINESCRWHGLRRRGGSDHRPSSGRTPGDESAPIFF